MEPHEGILVIQKPWPSIARAIWRDHARYLDTYMKVGCLLLFTRGGSEFRCFSSLILVTSSLVTERLATMMDISGLKVALMVSCAFFSFSCLHFWLTLMCPHLDVINVSGHRLSTAEIESALILHKGVAETAVIGTADEVTGQAVHPFVTLKPYVSFHTIVEIPLSLTDLSHSH